MDSSSINASTKKPDKIKRMISGIGAKQDKKKNVKWPYSTRAEGAVSCSKFLRLSQNQSSVQDYAASQTMNLPPLILVDR